MKNENKLNYDEFMLLDILNITNDAKVIKEYSDWSILIDGKRIYYTEHMFSKLELGKIYTVGELKKMYVEDW